MSTINYLSTSAQPIRGTITVPGDKSISHRALIFASIANGTSTIEGFLEGEDCLATLKAFRSMGVSIEGPNNQRVIIHGVGKYGLKKPEQTIDCGNSGTSIRLLAGLLAAQPFDSQLTGDESLLTRPMLRISKPLTQMGALIKTTKGTPPLQITGGALLKGITYEMPEASAQVKSSILLAGLYAQGETWIKETAISRNHTELMLKTFAYPIEQEGCSIRLASQGACKATEIKIPGDISSAAFFIVAATIIPGSELTIKQVGINPTRTGIIDILKQMGATINVNNKQFFGQEWVADLHVQYAQLKGITIDADLVPLAIDEFPIIFIAAACAEGETRLTGAEELRHKESDRLGVMISGLQRLGIDVEGFTDGVLIKGGTMGGGQVDSQGDHRVAMSFAVAGALATGGISIKNCANVATSFPSFIATATKVGLSIEELRYDK